ncbi:acetyltransferase [Moorella thermoacetica Y72]|uniref:Acetyltransferase n=2 Tax=Neomoorella thermoacetica TaxID=1525 RepID=A0A0S6UGD7_NEOTH|nr:acetyltransferase [Moorella thermoacetica Y72]
MKFMSLPIILVGGGGHALVIVDIIELIGAYCIVGFTDLQEKCVLAGYGLPYLGNDEVLPGLIKEGITKAAIGVGGFNNNLRRKLYSRCLNLGFDLPTLCHPGAIVARGASIGGGTVIMAGSIINPGVTVNENVIVNTGAIVEHDCRIGHSAQIGPGAILCGNVTVREEAFIGAGACIIQGVNVGARAFIGAGAVVTKDVPPGVTVVGNPARIIRGAN